MTNVRDGDEVEKIWKIAKSSRVAILTLQDDSHEMNARPMIPLIPEDEGLIWFITERHSPKMQEVPTALPALLTFTNTRAGDYLVVKGNVTVVDDRQKLAELWDKGDDIYFPEGPTDNAAVLLRFDPIGAEYWTGDPGVVKFALKFVQMKLTGGRPSVGNHGHVDL